MISEQDASRFADSLTRHERAQPIPDFTIVRNISKNTDLRRNPIIEEVLDDPDNMISEQEKNELFGVTLVDAADTQNIINMHEYTKTDFEDKFDEGLKVVRNAHSAKLGGILIAGPEPDEDGERFVKITFASRGQNNPNKVLRNDRARFFIAAGSRAIIFSRFYNPGIVLYRTVDQEKAEAVLNRLRDADIRGDDVTLLRPKLVKSSEETVPLR